MADENKTDSAESEHDDTSLSVEQVNQIVNSAISSRFKSFERKFEEFANKLTQQPESKSEPKKEEKVTNSDLVNLKRQLEAIQKERDEEVSKRKDFELRNTVKEALVKSGIAQHMIKPAMAVLVDSDKVVAYDDEDQLVYKSETGNLDILTGIKTWVKSDEGKAFVAPKGALGSGERSFGKAGKVTGQPQSRQEVGAMLEQALLNNFEE